MIEDNQAIRQSINLLIKTETIKTPIVLKLYRQGIEQWHL